MKKLKQLGMMQEFPKMASSPEMMKAYAEREGEPAPIPDKSLKDDLHEAMELMNSLSLNGKGRGRGVPNNRKDTLPTTEGSSGGMGRGRGYYLGNVKCWNCGELGHISPHCVGGEMYPVMQRMNDRTGDHGIEVKRYKSALH